MISVLWPLLWYLFLAALTVLVPGGTIAAYILWRRKMSRTIAIAYLFKNGEVRAYDNTGFQIREYNGSGPEAWNKVKAEAPRKAKLVENADWNEPWEKRGENPR